MMSFSHGRYIYATTDEKYANSLNTLQLQLHRLILIWKNICLSFSLLCHIQITSLSFLIRSAIPSNCPPVHPLLRKSATDIPSSNLSAFSLARTLAFFPLEASASARISSWIMTTATILPSALVEKAGLEGSWWAMRRWCSHLYSIFKRKWRSVCFFKLAERKQMYIKTEKRKKLGELTVGWLFAKLS